LSHPTNTAVLESEREAKEKKETTLEEITEPPYEELKELEQEDEKLI